MEPVSAAPPGYAEFNICHLTANEDPPAIQPDGHYTYATDETVTMVVEDRPADIPVHSLAHRDDRHLASG
jgi:hypothetical protein